MISIRTVYLIENCTIFFCTTATVLGLFYFSHSWYSLFGLLMLLFVNTSLKEEHK